MRPLFTLISALLLILLLRAPAHSQCNTTPCLIPQPAINAQDACILPNPDALDCYYGATTPDAPVSFPPSWCSQIHNNHWFAFTADAATVTFSISVFGCSSGNGIQAAVLSTTDCIDFAFVSACLGNILTQTTQTLTANGLTPGEVYYLCIDGSGGALCDYAINGSVPTVSGPSSGVCIPSSPTGTYTTNAPSTWQIIPSTAGNIVGPTTGTQITVQWTQAGPAQVCAKSIQCPDAPEDCLEVNIGEDVMTDEFVDLCQGHTTTCAGQTFSAPGTFNVNLNTFQNCDSTVRCFINLIPKVFSTETWYVCQGQSVECAGNEYFSPGSFPVTLPAWQGCDSVVTCKIIQIPTYVSPFYLVTMCGPADYSMCGNTFNSSGLFTEICTNWQGCDSIVNVNLAILEPQAVIAPPGVLDCTVNATITLNGSGSPPNNAVGGTTLYAWSGPGIVGFNNQPTVQVNQPGTYCLVVTHGRAGLYCSDTSCVTVTAFSSVPAVPQLAGNGTPCPGTALTYTATAVGNPVPTSYTWTTPNNIPYTPVPPNSINITWSGPPASGQLCVTANNSCGASQPACMPVTVQPALQQPVMAGPQTVCAGGGAYSFTLNGEQAGTTYTWTAPSGAVLTGAGDTVQINFQGASSGQVCVTAQNACATGAPVCRNVQVVPVPFASLSNDRQICAGETVDITFTLGGQAPFDVTWFNGTQNVTLNDIVNGHVVTVAPTLTTTYSLVGISDGALPAACTAVASDNLVVTVHPLFNQAHSAQICQGESILLGGALRTISGTYVDSLNTLHGCDSVVTTTLTVHGIDSVAVASTTCDPASAGITTQVLSQFNGCDSVVTSTVTLLPSDTTLLFDTNCDPANAGTFTQNLTNTYGCDSIVVTTVTYSLSDTTYLQAASCDVASTGVFTQNLTTVDGCDSLIITTVSLLPSDTTQLVGASCNPAEVGVFTQDLTNLIGCDSIVITTIQFFHTDTTLATATNCDPAATGVFYQTLVTPQGCDSVIQTTVTLLASDTTYLVGASCNPAEVGVFSQSLTNQNGCDSTIITTVDFFHTDTTLATATNCDPAATGVFFQTLVTPQGCDSVIQTTVTLLASDTTYLIGASCNPAEVGVFSQSLTNQNGCDSTIITTVDFFHTDTTLATATNCDPAATGVFFQTLVTPQGCDSVIQTTVTLLASDTTYLVGASCNPAEVGVFSQSLTNQNGCDSTIITTVDFFHTDTTLATATHCDPAATGIFFQTLVTPQGCDSVVQTTVTLLASDTTYLVGSSCNPAEVGVFSQSLTNQNGCDSTIITTVDFFHTDTTLAAATNCDPAAVGVFFQTLVTPQGCDSVVQTTVTLLASDTTYLLGTTCNPAEVGVFSQSLTNQNGCDSTIITTVDFFHTDTTLAAATSCDPSDVGVFFQTLVTPQGCDSVVQTTVILLASDTTYLLDASCNPASVGVFTQNLTNQNGCDSTVITTVSFSLTDTTLVAATSCDPAAIGVFAQTLITPEGCDSTVITTVSLLPSNSTQVSGTSCIAASVGVFTQVLSNQFGCDSTVVTTITLVQTDTTLLATTNCDPAATGVFTQNLVTPEGCDSVVITTVTLLPSNVTDLASTTCDPAAAGVFTQVLSNQYGCDSTVTETVTLLPSDITNLTLSTCEPTQAGTVTTILTNQWGCDSTVIATTSLLPSGSCDVQALLSGSTIPCGSTTGSLTVTATLGEAPFQYIVLQGATPVASGTITTLGLAQQVNGLPPGNYSLTVSSANGFTTTTAVAGIVQLVPPALVASVLSNYSGYAVSCAGATDGTALATPSGGAPPYTFVWSDGSLAQQASSLTAGAYSVTVTDANQCTITAAITLAGPAPLQLGFNVNDLDCFGQHDGAIVAEPTGGIPPYQYTLDTAPFQNANTFIGLTSGTYTVSVADANNCQQTEIIVVNAAIPLDVALGDDQIIQQGSSTVLQAVVNVPLDSILLVVWTPPFDSSECPQCLDQVVAPFVSTSYSVRVTSLNGCTDEDRTTVVVDRSRYIYVPNVFSPGSGGGNALFTIYAREGTVRQLRGFQIFDRWGEAVYAADSFPPNDPAVGWNGSFKGQPMSPGVFVWVVEVEFIDGETVLYKGDVTVVR